MKSTYKVCERAQQGFSDTVLTDWPADEKGCTCLFDTGETSYSRAKVVAKENGYDVFEEPRV